MRALHVMSSPLTDAMVTQWILDGVAEHMVTAVRREANARLKIAKEQLRRHSMLTTEGAFHLWLSITKESDWAPSELAAQLRELGVSAVSSAAFSTDNNPPDAVRLCFGGPITRDQWKENLQQTAELMSSPSYLITGIH
jgi:DNA-binding transcriptional MocR family regulator